MRPNLEGIKEYLQDQFYLNRIQKLIVMVGLIVFFFGLWQMDVICIPRIWNDPPMYGALAASQNLVPYDMGFAAIFGQSFMLNTGQGYNICQALMVVGMVMLFLGFWFWKD